MVPGAHAVATVAAAMVGAGSNIKVPLFGCC
jgi:hypothetical protein